MLNSCQSIPIRSICVAVKTAANFALKIGQGWPITLQKSAIEFVVMINIPPNPPLILPAELKRGPRVNPVDRSSEREMPIPSTTQNIKERRRTQRERRGEAGQRLKGYDMRSGRDRRKNDRDQPAIETEA